MKSSRRNATCLHCGYNLAGLPRSAPCPECGKTGRPRSLASDAQAAFSLVLFTASLVFPFILSRDGLPSQSTGFLIGLAWLCLISAILDSAIVLLIPKAWWIRAVLFVALFVPSLLLVLALFATLQRV